MDGNPTVAASIKANQAQGRRKKESTYPGDDKVIDKVNDEVPELQPIRVVCLEVDDAVESWRKRLDKAQWGQPFCGLLHQSP